MDSNRTNIPMPDDFISACAFAQEVVHAIVEIHVLARSRTVSALNHHFQGPSRVNIPGSSKSSAKRKDTTALRGASSPAAAFWPMSGPSQSQREGHESSLTSCSGQVCTRWLSGVHASKGAHALQLE